MAGTTQVQVDERWGMGFTSAIRWLLRQDPDVVLLGEIRDLLVTQVTHAVRWRESVQWMAAQGVTEIWEVGAGDGLQNEAAFVPTSEKIRLADMLAAAGLTRIELYVR